MAASSPSQAPPLIPPPPLESTTVVAEYSRIINAHPRHFLTLSLFFLPISCLPLLLPTFQKTFISATSDAQVIPILILISSSLFIFTSYLFAIASITNSVCHAFHHTAPLTHTLTLTPPIHSFLSLASTAFYAQLPVLGTLLLSRYLLHLSGLEPMLPGMTLSSCFVISQLIWGLAYVVAVVESKSGVRAWKRSFDLLMMMTRKKKVDQMKTGLGYYCKLVFGDGVYMGLMFWGIFPSLPHKRWFFAVLIPCMIIPALAITLLTNTMSFAVFYMMSLKLTVDDDDDIENQLQAPLLVSV